MMGSFLFFGPERKISVIIKKNKNKIWAKVYAEPFSHNQIITCKIEDLIPEGNCFITYSVGYLTKEHAFSAGSRWKKP